MIGRSRCSPASRVASRMDLPWSAEFDRCRHAQHRVLGAETDQYEQPDLEVDVVLEPAQPIGQKRAENAERHGRHDGARQRPGLVLRGKHEEHDDQAEDKCDHRGSARFLLFEGETRPCEGVAGREDLARHGFHRRDRFAGAVARRWVADYLRRRKAIEMRQQIGPRNPLRVDERRERHHLVRGWSACTDA